MDPQKGFFEILGGSKKNTRIEVLYFPSEYSLEKSNTFSEVAIPGLESPYLQFVKGNAGSITLELFYDSYEKGIDVRELTGKITDLINIDPTIHAPPPLQFIWGLNSKEPFNCVLERVTKRFTMFNSDGKPVRARLNITLKNSRWN